MKRAVTLIGGRGYTGEILLALVERHPDLELARVGSRSLAGRPVAEVFPGLSTPLTFEAIRPETLARIPFDDDEAVVLALPNGEAARYVRALPEGVAVVDLSADHRFDPAWHYGLPELVPRQAGSPRRIANPGCYATAVQLALAPVAGELIDWPSAFGVSGYSGAGRKPSPRNDPERLADNLVPYALSGHVHEREVSQRLAVPVRFLPHVGAFFRGITVTCTARLAAETTREALLERYRAAYAPHPLVAVHEDIPEVRQVAGTPRAAVGGFTVDARDPRHVVIVSVLDNLLKGAASQAVQNLNELFGVDPLAGLSP